MSDYFPRDLEIQILKRLPLTSILKSRTVCKSWNTLITTHDFISAHLNFTQSVIPNSLFIRYFDRTHKTDQYVTAKDDHETLLGSHFHNIELQNTSKNAYFRIVGYCQGVVCLTDDLFDSMSTVILWNPSVKKSVRVLIPDYEPTWHHGTVLGFGVCPRTHDPKVVRIMYAIEDPLFVEVFSLASRAWRKPFNSNSNSNRSDKMIRRITWSQVCLNGVIHWVACDERIEAGIRCLVVSFDLVREVVDEVLLPDALARQNVLNLSISERRGCLTMLEYDMDKGKECCGVWVMKEYGVTGSWGKMYVVGLPGMLRRVVGFRVNGDVVLALKNHELVFVDQCTGIVKSLGIYGNIRSFFVGWYVESLILI